MNNLINFMMTIFLFILFIMLMINKLNFKMKNNNFMNNIECGFNNMNNKHIPIYNNFFMIMIIFLIFDLEFFLIIPLILLFNKLNWIKLIMMMLIIFFFIYFSLLYEIKMNCINWIKLDKFYYLQ